MKKSLLAICMLVSSIGYSQSTKEGTISASAGIGILIGGATLDQTTTIGSLTATWPQETGFAIGETFGVRGQYGINKMFGVGAYLRGESMGFLTEDADVNNATIISSLGLGIGVEGRIYAINHKKFNLHFAPTVGFATASTDISNDNSDYVGSLSGLNYGVTGGINIFFANFSDVGIGLSADLGYNHSSLSGKCTDTYVGSSVINQTLSYGGVYIGVGFAVHF